MQVPANTHTNNSMSAYTSAKPSFRGRKECIRRRERDGQTEREREAWCGEGYSTEREGERGTLSLLNQCVNKRLLKLSGLRPGVFTASVSITNKSRLPPSMPPLSHLALLGTAN